MTVTLTHSNSELGTSDFVAAPVERETGVQAPETQNSEVTQGDRLRELSTAARGYFTTPNLLTNPPASLQELAAYAHRGTWTADPKVDPTAPEDQRRKTPRRGLLRTLGIAWHRVVGIPTTAVCRYVEWIAQRPGRSIVVFALWKAFITTGGGPWVTDNIITPTAHVAAWVWL